MAYKNLSKFSQVTIALFFANLLGWIIYSIICGCTPPEYMSHQSRDVSSPFNKSKADSDLCQPKPNCPTSLFAMIVWSGFTACLIAASVIVEHYLAKTGLLSRNHAQQGYQTADSVVSVHSCNQ